MNPRMNLSPQIEASVPTMSANTRLSGKDIIPYSARPPARIKPKMNRKRIVTGPMITDDREVARIRNDTFAGMKLDQFIWQPCQQVESLQQDGSKYIYRDGEVRGYGAAYRLDDTHFRLNLIVDPAHTNQGIGTLLLSNVEDATRRVGGKYLQARVLENMESSLRFAQSRGFEKVHTMR